MRSEVVICGVSSYMEDRVRLFKLKKVLDANQIRFDYWGWKRKHSNNFNPDYNITYLANGGSGKLIPIFYLWWMFSLFWKFVFYKGANSSLFYCVGFEAGFPAYLASKVKNMNYVFDNPDNIYLSHRLPNWLVRGLARLEQKIAYGAKKHVLPGKSRWSYDFGNEFYIPNTPLKEDLRSAEQILYQPFQKSNESQLVIYITGRLVDVRGLNLLRYAIEHTTQANFYWLIAGYADDDMKSLFQRYHNVSYLGRISSIESLALYYQSDIVFAFYDPALPINRIAESNKWWDCVATGTPFISNHGILNLKAFVDANACFLIDYYNAKELCELLEQLHLDRDALVAVKRNLKTLVYASWEEIVKIFK